VTTVELSVILAANGQLRLRNWSSPAQFAPGGRVDLTGLGGRVLRFFEQWMTIRERTPAWTEEEIRVFGQLLHQRLFPAGAWEWIERQRKPAAMTRVMLAFPSDAASSPLAALPWEYLCTPDRPGQDGEFLVLTPWLLLSRVVPSGVLQPATPPGDHVRILPVVGDAKNSRLGLVDFEPVLTAIADTSHRPGFSTLDPLLEATEAQLASAVAEHQPHVVHVLAHGRFRDGRGAVALRDVDGGTHWLDEERLARALCQEAWNPAVVILHACEGGAVDYEYRFAGLAPSIVRRGALCVVGMQYAVTNATAIAFSTALYAALAEGQNLDEALQTARQRLWDDKHDPRLIGIPTIYQRSAQPLLASKGGGR
jgi:hypothetical protein